MEKSKYFEVDYENLDVDLLRQTIKGDPSYKNIFSGIWCLVEEIGDRGNLQGVVKILLKFHQDQLNAMRQEWERASGQPMTQFQEELAFQNPKSQVSMALIYNMIAFIDHIDKASQIAKLFGLNSLDPLVISKKARGPSKGGKGKAEQNKDNLETFHKKIFSLYQDIKKRNRMSDNSIDIQIAQIEGISKSTVYNIRRKYASKENSS